MSRSRLLVVVQALLAVAALILVSHYWRPGDMSPAAWWLAGGVVITSALLAALSVWLPRGDTIDHSVAIGFGAGSYLAPHVAGLAVLVGWMLGALASSRKVDPWRTLEHLGRRVLLMAGAYGAFMWLVPILYGVVLPRADLRGISPLATVLAPGFSKIDTTMAFIAVGFFGVLFVMLDTLLEQIQSAARLETPLLPLLAGTIRSRGWMLVAEMSVAVLTVLVYPTLNMWGIVISTGMLVIMRRSFVLLRDMQTSYTLTIEVLARSLEAYDSERRGHAESVANMVAAAARRIGFPSKRLEDVTYGALFHDVARLGSDDAEGEVQMTSSDVLGEVQLLAGAIPMLRMLDSAGDVADSPEEEDVIGAYLIARFSDIDDTINRGRQPNPELAQAIGRRLYSSTRAAVERVIREVERTAPELTVTSQARMAMYQ